MITGSGGRDLSGNKRTAAQSFDQELTRTNAALASNCAAEFNKKDGADAGDNWKKGKPIRCFTCCCANTLNDKTTSFEDAGRKERKARNEARNLISKGST